MRFERDDARVGFLVLLAAGLFAFLAVYHGVGLLGRRDVRHLVRLDDAAELAVGTEVQLQGFRVGQVEEVELRRDGTKYTFVARLAVRPDVVLWKGTKGVVSSKIMGSPVLELRLPPPAERLAELPPGEVMASETSASLGTLVEELTALSANVNRAVSEVRVELQSKGLSSVFEHPQVRRALGEVAGAMATFRKAAVATSGTMAQADDAFRTFDRTLRRLEASLVILQGLMERRGADLDATVAKLGPVLDRIDTLAVEATELLNRLGPEADEGLAALRRTLESTQELVEILKAKPNRVVFGTPTDEEREQARESVERSRQRDAVVAPATASSPAVPPPGR